MTILELLTSALAANGIGELLRPFSIRRNAKATREALYQDKLMLAQVDAQIDDVKEGRSVIVTMSDGRRAIMPAQADARPAVCLMPDEANPSLLAQKAFEPKRLAERALAFAAADSIRKEVNVEKAILTAEEDLFENDGEREGATPPIDADWLHRWRDAAAQSSTEELQRLWGRVLAGEARDPGSFSFRALEFLRSVSQSEARLIELLVALNMSGGVFWGDKQLLEALGLPFAAILELEGIGVLNGVSGGLSRQYNSSEVTHFHVGVVVGRKVILADHDDPNLQVTLPFLVLTRVGKELTTLVNSEPSDSYVMAVAKAFHERGCKTSIADITETRADGRIGYINARPFSPVS